MNPPNQRLKLQFLLAAVAVATVLGAGCRVNSFNTAPAAQAAKPYPVVYATVPPQIDGILDDNVWTQATPCTAFYDFLKDKRPVDIAVAYVAWDKENLYFAMRICDQDLYAVEKESDKILCLADVAELFIKPREDRLDLYEFEMNMLDAVWYLHYISRGGGADSRFTETSHQGLAVRSIHEGTINDWNDVDGWWTVEMAVPLTLFNRAVPAGPRQGDIWRVNIGGYDFSCYREDTLQFTSCPDLIRQFAQYERYMGMQFMPPAD